MENRTAYFAHTATTQTGAADRDPSRWQLLKDHLCAVAQLARGFARPCGLQAEAELAGLLHDLGKYAARFQARLHDHSIHGINHWAAGAAHAAELRFHNSAFAVDGHHTGMPARDGDGLKQTIARMRSDAEREDFCKCVEPLSELLRRLTEDGLRLPDIPARTAGDPFSEALRTRLLFSCLVDADFRDTDNRIPQVSIRTAMIIHLRARGVPAYSHGRFFCISAPRVGASSVSQTPKRFMPCPGLDGFHTARVLRARRLPARHSLRAAAFLLRAGWPSEPAFPHLHLHPPWQRSHAPGPRPIPDAAASPGPQRSASGSGRLPWLPHRSRTRPATPSARAAGNHRQPSQSLPAWRETTKTRQAKQTALCRLPSNPHPPLMNPQNL